MTQTIRVFVYGTLKKGEPNHATMVDTAGHQKFVGRGITLNLYPLVVASKYNIPFLLKNPGYGNRIEGEVYEIDEEKLAILDELEAYPALYDRLLEKIELEDKSVTEAWVYVMPKWRPDILTISTPEMSSYSSLGSHGRPYIEKYVRAKELLEGIDESEGDYNLFAEIQGTDPHDQHTVELTKQKALNDLKST